MGDNLVLGFSDYDFCGPEKMTGFTSWLNVSWPHLILMKWDDSHEIKWNRVTVE